MKLSDLRAHSGTLGLVLLLGLFLGIAYLSNQDVGTYDSTDPGYNQAYWLARIARVGPEKSYSEFTEKNAQEEYERQHLSAHVMGELLFKTLGEKGIVVCDATFGFGCYHGFFGRAISEGGVESIRRLNTACVEEYGALGTGCQHGMGHGILEYVGYGNIVKALTLCKETTQLVPLLGCTSGVFMEYNSPLAGIAEGLVPSTRVVSSDTPYEPCTKVPEEYQASCYFELGSWLPTIPPQDYEEAGELCAGLSGSARTHCFLGLGSSLAYRTNYDLSSALTECAEFSELDELSCRAGVSWGFYSVPEHRSSALDACEYTDETQRATCESLSDLTQGLDAEQP